MHYLCMATKTISLHVDAYDRLVRARRSLAESFSQVVLRAEWPRVGITGAELLSLVKSGHFRLSETALDEIEALDTNEQPPEDKWRTG
jgi:hypothetical protein